LHVVDAASCSGEVLGAPLGDTSVHGSGERDDTGVDRYVDLRRVEIARFGQTVADVLAYALVGTLIAAGAAPAMGSLIRPRAVRPRSPELDAAFVEIPARAADVRSMWIALEALEPTGVCALSRRIVSAANVAWRAFAISVVLHVPAAGAAQTARAGPKDRAVLAAALLTISLRHLPRPPADRHRLC
jgi:hypothetical protein